MVSSTPKLTPRISTSFKKMINKLFSKVYATQNSLQLIRSKNCWKKWLEMTSLTLLRALNCNARRVSLILKSKRRFGMNSQIHTHRGLLLKKRQKWLDFHHFSKWIWSNLTKRNSIATSTRCTNRTPTSGLKLISIVSFQGKVILKKAISPNWGLSKSNISSHQKEKPPVETMASSRP